MKKDKSDKLLDVLLVFCVILLICGIVYSGCRIVQENDTTVIQDVHGSKVEYYNGPTILPGKIPGGIQIGNMTIFP